jgi:hypothetical protein
MRMRAVIAAVLLTCAAGCATLEQLRALVQPPRFEEAEDQRAEIRLVGPSAGRPLGGAAVRIWTKVTNPNAFGVTLGTLSGTLFLDGSRAATADFPLGLPLTPGQEHVVRRVTRTSLTRSTARSASMPDGSGTPSSVR